MSSPAPESLDYIRGWLRGFFDGEGSVRLAFYSVHPRYRTKRKQPSREIYAVNTDFVLIEKAQKYLSILRIPFRLNIHRNRSYPGCKRCWKIRIGTNGAIITFAEEVGFTTGWKVDKLQELVAWCSRSYKAGWHGTRNEKGQFVKYIQEEKPCQLVQ